MCVPIPETLHICPKVMDPASWTHVKALFQAAVELAPPDREAFLEQRCIGDDQLHQEVSGLLSAHETAGDFIQQPALVDVGLIASDGQTTSGVAVTGQKIGSYQIISELGRGGMGAVYLAARADDSFDKQVALKLIKRGMDSDAIIKRFVMERQILANLDHPNIARLIDGGTTEDGLPYFVLEYVEGTTITRYCDRHKLNTLERVKLFRQVCAAVLFAHQNLVVHRDLKPSNIIVTEDGTPKLLDFGIAKLLSGSTPIETTATIGRVLTPEYASPEQLRGLPITTRSDVYSLGVVLYELLSGHRPFNFESRSPEDVARMITVSQPLKPSVVITRIKDARQTDDAEHVPLTPAAISRTRDGNVEKLRRRLAGDLDNILLKALRKEPERRYASVQEFWEDLRRHLEGLPVLARPDTLSYRTSKFVTRHKAGVAAAVIVLLTLVSATVITSWQARVARRERDKAERRFNQVRKLAKSVLFEYHDGIEKLPGSTAVREKMVKDALEYLDNLSAESTGDLALQTELAIAYEKVGDVQGNPYGANLGNQDGALASYRKALSIREGLYAANRADAETKLELSNGYKKVADILWAKGENERALANYRSALANYSELAQADPKNMEYVNAVSFALIGIGNVQRQSGDSKGALETARRLLANAEAALAADAKDQSSLRSVAIANLKVGDAFVGVTDYADALPHYEKAVEGFSELASLAHNSAPTVRLVGLGYARLALVYKRLKQYEKAAEYNLKAIDQQKQAAVADPTNVQGHFDIAVTYGNLGDNYLQIKRLDAAARSVRQAIRIFSEGLARNPDYLQAQGNLGETYATYGEILLAKGEAGGALENFRKAVTILEREPVRSGRTTGLASSYAGLGKGHAALAANHKTSAQQRLAHWCEARSWFQKSLEIYRMLRDAGKLTGEDGARLDTVIKEIAKCDAAIARLGG